MPARRPTPLISDLELQPRNAPPESPFAGGEEEERHRQPWYHRLPLAGTVGLILAPHPSILWMLVDHHWRILAKPRLFFLHLAVIYTLTFLMLSSLIICVARDPGPVAPTAQKEGQGLEGGDDNMDLAEALMEAESDDIFKPGRWCRKCWAAKPERTHHCSICRRCVLKMDHHCPWLGSNCVGHRTYPAFVHFLTCITILAIYIAAVSIDALLYSFHHPFEVSETTPVHELILAAYGVVFSIVIGPFAAYHYYLITINQTTLENISPFLLLRYLPPLPSADHSLSDPPLEPELCYAQRRAVKDAHGALSLYDLGWRRNWAQALGWDTPRGWATRILCGGASPGDGRRYPHNPRAEGVLAKLAEELVKLDSERRY